MPEATGPLGGRRDRLWTKLVIAQRTVDCMRPGRQPHEVVERTADQGLGHLHHRPAHAGQAPARQERGGHSGGVARDSREAVYGVVLRRGAIFEITAATPACGIDQLVIDRAVPMVGPRGLPAFRLALARF